MKKKGKPDPFAYIPLNHKTLNKRKAVKSHGVFSKVVKAAKKGANKGNKYKVKEVKKMMESMKVWEVFEREDALLYMALYCQAKQEKDEK